MIDYQLMTFIETVCDLHQDQSTDVSDYCLFLH